MASAGLIKRLTEASLPGPTIESSRIDEDGVVVQILETRKLRSAITEGETIVTGVWTKTFTEGETALVATEVVESRPVPGNTLVAFTTRRS